MTERFTITRTLGSPRTRVFEALTIPEQFAVWFGTSAIEVPLDTLTMEVRPGGALAAVMLLPDGGRIDWRGEYTAVEPPAHLSMTLTDQPGTEPGLPVLFDLTEVDGGTELTISQDRAHFTDEQVEATIQGYHSFIDEIESLVADSPAD